MLTEEALILVGLLVAFGLLVLGVWNLVSPSSQSVRRGQPVALRSKPVTSVVEPVAEPERAESEVEEPPPVAASPVSEAPVREVPVSEPPLAASPVIEPPVEKLPAAGAPFAQFEITPPAPPAAPAPSNDPGRIAERCRSLIADGRFEEAVSTAMVVLEQPGTVPAPVTAALWQEVSSARDRMGDREGALAALRKAIESAPDSDAHRLRQECATWAAMTTREMLLGVPEHGDRYTPLAAARAFVGKAQEFIEGSPALDAMRADLDVDVWPAYETRVRTLIAERDPAEAYRLATEALSDPALPASLRPTFEEFRVDTLAARIIVLAERAEIAVSESREWEAVGALERGETLLRSAGALPADRREDAASRLSAAYARLGGHRVAAGEFEDAVDPLLRSLRVSKAETPARDEARSAMVRALQGVVEMRVAVIRDVAASGNSESAAAQAEKVWALLRTGIAAGAPQEPLNSAIATVRRLIEEFGGNTA